MPRTLSGGSSLSGIYRKVFLTDMQSISTNCQCYIQIIIHDKKDVILPAQFLKGPGDMDKGPFHGSLVTELDNLNTSLNDLAGSFQMTSAL
jgi:hypothetical protein